jgi:hypothetical protein
MEGYCSTGQSPRRAAVPVEEEDECQNSNGVFRYRLLLEMFEHTSITSEVTWLRMSYTTTVRMTSFS